MNHSIEPWELSVTGDPHDQKARWICDCFVSEFIEKNEKEANAYRIVACVNACTGIKDPASAINNAREALELALEVIAATGPGSYPEAEDAIADALATLKGGAE